MMYIGRWENRSWSERGASRLNPCNINCKWKYVCTSNAGREDKSYYCTEATSVPISRFLNLETGMHVGLFLLHWHSQVLLSVVCCSVCTILATDVVRICRQTSGTARCENTSLVHMFKFS